MGSSKAKTSAKKTTATAKKAVTKAKVAKVTKAAAPKRAKPAKAAPVEVEPVIEAVETVRITPSELGAVVETVEAVQVETPAVIETVEVKTERVLPWAEVEQLVRQEAFRLAQRRHFRDGTPEQDWFAAEAAVKAQLQARGFTLAN